MATYARESSNSFDPTLVAVFPGASEMAARCRAFDWSATALGPVATWPQSLRTLVAMTLEARHPMLLWWGPELIQIFNDAFLPSFGTTGRDVTALGAPGRVHWADVWEIVGAQIDGVVSSGVATWYEDALIPIERNGRLEDVWWTYGYSPVRDESGRVNGVLVVVQETTNRVMLERQLRASVDDSARARGEAESANRTKGEFLAVMSHELRTPLNAIGGYVELLEMGIQGPLTPAQRDALARVQQSQRHLLGLINQVLNYTRIETSTVTYDITDVIVAESLASAEALVVPQVRAHGLTYVLDQCDPSLVVRADPEKLRQILLNVLTNAIKFTEPSGRISVSCAATDDTVTIAMRDTGIGIPADKLASVFEPFVQIDARFTRTREGVGLGLAISRDLARGMQGDLTAESELGAGSVFTLQLPRAH
jgi:signal transduction histidine kinase